MSVQCFMAVHPIAIIEIYQSGPKWQTNLQTLVYRHWSFQIMSGFVSLFKMRTFGYK